MFLLGGLSVFDKLGNGVVDGGYGSHHVVIIIEEGLVGVSFLHGFTENTDLLENLGAGEELLHVGTFGSDRDEGVRKSLVEGGELGGSLLVGGLEVGVVGVSLLGSIGLFDEQGHSFLDRGSGSYDLVIVRNNGLVLVSFLDVLLESVDGSLDGFALELVLHVRGVLGDSGEGLGELGLETCHEGVGVLVSLLAGSLCGHFVVMCFLGGLCVGYELGDGVLDFSDGGHDGVIVAREGHVGVCSLHGLGEIVDAGIDLGAGKLVFYVGGFIGDGG